MMPKKSRVMQRPTGAGDNDCWIWENAKFPSGYGRIANDAVHRLSFQQANPHVDISGLHVLHKCDNPPCYNPRHLSAGTHLDNMRDKALKLRQRGPTESHCRYGHEYTPANTYHPKNDPFLRQCRKCNAAACARRKARINAVKGEARA